MTTIFNPTSTNIPMIKEWNADQFKAMRAAILKHFRGRTIVCESGTTQRVTMSNYAVIDSTFGLAYTSSGLFACYGVCNCQPLFDADGIYSYCYFTIGEDGNYYAILQDNDENELCIEL
jgi:hypothetical protein